MKRTTLTLALALLATPLLAQSALIPEQILRIKATSLVCNANTEGKMYRVVDASSLGDCDTTGGGTVSALCLCDNLSFVPIAVDTDLAASYVLVTKAGQQSVTASGAGNDVSLVAADDVILTPADAFTVSATGAASITAGAASKVETSAGAVTIDSVGGADEVVVDGTAVTGDITLTAIDDLIFAAGDDWTGAPTGLINFTPGESFAVTTTAGAITLTAGGTTQDVSLVSVDDVLLSPTDDLTVAAADIALGATTTIALDAAGSTDELGIAENSVSISAGIAFRIVGGTAPPAACAAGTKGTMYYDTDINKMCLCNGTDYVLMNDDSTTAGCS